MNNICKIGLMPLLVFTVIAIGLFGISIVTTVVDVSGEKKVVINTDGNTDTIITEKWRNWSQCSNWNPRC